MTVPPHSRTPIRVLAGITHVRASTLAGEKLDAATITINPWYDTIVWNVAGVKWRSKASRRLDRDWAGVERDSARVSEFSAGVERESRRVEREYLPHIPNTRGESR